MRALYDVPAPAKLNLFLHITGRRSDGYHLLQSVFMLLDWQDRLCFERCNTNSITRSDNMAGLPTEDLCVRAALALQAATGCQQGAHIHLEKSIPAQAGMGGGSSDAATTLLALNRLWQLHLPRKALEQIGITLGADVPFFLRGRNAWVEGVGEVITPLTGVAALPAAHFAILKPPVGLATPAIFAHPYLQRDTKHATMAGFAVDHYGFGRNDLQSVASVLCPEIKNCLEFLEMHKFQARMTGSGSAVFAKVHPDFAPPALPAGWIFKVCENLQKHPLYEWVQD